MQDDKELWRDFLGGSSAAFGALYERFADELISFGLRYTKDRDLVKDAIQDLFIELDKYRSGLSDCDNVTFYLLKSLKRRIMQSLSQTIKYSIDFNEASKGPFEPFAYSEEELLISSEQEKETLRVLQLEIDQLTEHQREILYLKYNRELNYEEIADLMQISVPSSRTLLYRTLKLLRSKLDKTVVIGLFFTGLS